VTGSLALDAVRIDAPQHGLSLRDGEARVALEEPRITVQSAAIRGGDGTFRASGAITRDERDATFEWRAEQLRLLNRPDRQLVASGSGTATLTGGKVVLRGELRAERGSFVFEQSEGERLGDDVVVVGRTAKPAAKGRRVPLLDFDVTLHAGEHLHVRSSGLDSDLRGRLRVRSREDGQILAHGGVELYRGSYRAFGQKLEIERGKLTFDGSVRNPALDLRALRKNQPVEAGVEVRGTLQTPVTRLVSEPPVPDQEKLAWLMLGRSAADAQGAEAALLQAALASITKSRTGSGGIGADVAQRFGLDEIGLRGGVGGGHVVALGKRIAERIYIDYEQGLTVAETLVRLRVQLTKTLNARIETGSQRGRIGLGYDISYD
jgi:translocation and assembly module TamB